MQFTAYNLNVPYTVGALWNMKTIYNRSGKKHTRTHKHTQHIWQQFPNALKVDERCVKCVRNVCESRAAHTKNLPLKSLTLSMLFFLSIPICLYCIFVLVFWCSCCYCCLTLIWLRVVHIAPFPIMFQLALSHSIHPFPFGLSVTIQWSLWYWYWNEDTDMN